LLLFQQPLGAALQFYEDEVSFTACRNFFERLPNGRPFLAEFDVADDGDVI